MLLTLISFFPTLLTLLSAIPNTRILVATSCRQIERIFPIPFFGWSLLWNIRVCFSLTNLTSTAVVGDFGDEQYPIRKRVSLCRLILPVASFRRHFEQKFNHGSNPQVAFWSSKYLSRISCWQSFGTTKKDNTVLSGMASFGYSTLASEEKASEKW